MKNINLQIRVEKLLIFLIPYFIFYVCFSVGNTIASQLLLEKLTTNPADNYIFFKISSILPILLKLIFNLSIGIWLYIQAKDFQLKPVLWSLFGVIQPFIALSIFVMVVFYNKKFKIVSTEKENIV
jgi:glucan phosphoethanolaminetransferase (alkaline phosphatase superfamily)